MNLKQKFTFFEKTIEKYLPKPFKLKLKEIAQKPSLIYSRALQKLSANSTNMHMNDSEKENNVVMNLARECSPVFL